MTDKKMEQANISARWKRWKLKSSIILMLLGAVAVIVYLFRAGLAKQYEGLGAALCVIACGGFLVWHVIHLFAEQDVIEEQKINVNQATVSPSQSNQADKKANPDLR
jgi:hypothetical protein